MNIEEIKCIFPVRERDFLIQALERTKDIQEIRIRTGKPVLIKTIKGLFYINKSGELTNNIELASLCSEKKIDEILRHVCMDSVYAYQDEIKKGFLTVKGGHRIGITGQVVLDDMHSVGAIKNISCLNIRISHEIKGIGECVLPYIYKNGKFQNTLIISSPGCGKTTLLRDLIRFISNGNSYGEPLQVGVVDERSEIGGCYRGVPQNDLGNHTDIMDACPKSVGMLMLLRSMAPQVIALDELGGEEDCEALWQVLHCGCRIIATIHGESIEEMKQKKHFRAFLEDKIFERYIILDKLDNQPIIKEILNEDLIICSKG